MTVSERSGEGRHPVPDEGQRQVFLAGEVPEEGPLGDVDRVGDLVDGRDPAGGRPWVMMVAFGAMLQPTALALLRETCPVHWLNWAIGIWGAVIGASTAAGPIVGGVLPAARSFDIPGIVMLSSSLFLLIWGLVKGSAYGWGTPKTLAFPGGAAVAALLVVLRESRAKQPLLPLRLFRSLSAGAVLVVLMMFALFGAMFCGVAGGLQSTAMQIGGTLGRRARRGDVREGQQPAAGQLARGTPASADRSAAGRASCPGCTPPSWWPPRWR
jgi:MFS family permease